ncbi:MAG TPA: hydrogen peroxide-dependent heme synthase [Bryobacterales bacterium]|nr:hydrogen peroxide-dependent heme synthase [Bryobacterales bacterium]
MSTPNITEKPHGHAHGAPAAEPVPAVPLTLDGSSVLHQMFRIRWTAWRGLADNLRRGITDEAVAALEPLESHPEGGTALFSQLGHKGDLMVVHFRRSFGGLNAAELALSQLRLSEYLDITTSYVSVVELGLYASTIQLHEELAAKGIAPGSLQWQAAEEEKLEEQRQAMAPRLWPTVPPHKYLCFYPMDKKRGEIHNWYSVPIGDRGRMMRDHGLIGRRYAGKVKQIISGSIGFDDWEWGVDLFANDPLVFKKLIYEMRFDEASALYALFGKFYMGLRLPAAQLGGLLSGKTPEYEPPAEAPHPSGRPGA